MLTSLFGDHLSIFFFSIHCFHFTFRSDFGFSSKLLRLIDNDSMYLYLVAQHSVECTNIEEGCFTLKKSVWILTKTSLLPHGVQY